MRNGKQIASTILGSLSARAHMAGLEVGHRERADRHVLTLTRNGQDAGSLDVRIRERTFEVYQVAPGPQDDGIRTSFVLDDKAVVQKDVDHGDLDAMSLAVTRIGRGLDAVAAEIDARLASEARVASTRTIEIDASLVQAIHWVLLARTDVTRENLHGYGPEDARSEVGDLERIARFVEDNAGPDLDLSSLREEMDHVRSEYSSVFGGSIPRP